jgi:uncharacterized ion transporter superfamily protein YfcC
MEVLMTPIFGFKNSVETVAFVLIVGGVFGIISKTGAFNRGILLIVNVFKGKEIYLIPVCMYSFSIWGAMFGLQEVTIPFIGIFVPLCVAIGYDRITGLAITYGGVSVGFSSAVLNPFNVGLAQSIAGVPLFTGILYRFILWFTFTTITVIFVMVYAKKIKENPSLSYTYHLESDGNDDLVPFNHPEKDMNNQRNSMVLITVLIGFIIIIWGVTQRKWYLDQISGIFIAMGILSGLFGKMSFTNISKSFVEGIRNLVEVAFLLGLSKGIVILATQGKIIDTLLYTLSYPLNHFPKMISVVLILFIQKIASFFITSASSLAALTLPLMNPLGDLLGISRQTTVLTYQFGNGFTNMIYPTSATLMASLGIAKVDWWVWVKWMIRLQIIYLLLCILGITVAVVIHF